ncbi:MAG: MarR family winged helix-turn-helix transcriptional regulator [Acutalibacteraceae bacterium]
MPRYHSADVQEKLILNLRDIFHMMQMQYEGRASQKRILIILHECGTLTQKDLTERLGIQPGSVSEILSKLENAGLIARIPNETDRRTADISLTDMGAEQASEAAEQRQKRHEEMFSCLTQEEQATLLSMLEKIHMDWEGRFPPNHAHGFHRGHGFHGDRHHGRHFGPEE